MHLVSVHTAGSGQLEPSQSCAWSGGTSIFQAGVPIKLKSPHLELWSGGTSTLHACLPVKLKSGGFTLAQPSWLVVPLWTVTVAEWCCHRAWPSSPVGFLNFDIDTTMHTWHKPHISEWWGFCDQTSQFACGMWRQSTGTFFKFCIYHSINVLTEAHYSPATALWSCPDSEPPSGAWGLPTCWS